MKLKEKPFAPILVPHPITGEEMTVNPKRDLRIDRNDIDRELAEQPGIFAWYAELTSAAKKRWEDAKIREDRLRDKLTSRLFREERELPASRRRTVTAVKGEAARDLKLKVLIKKTREARQVYERLEKLLPAFNDRSYSLQSLARRQSQEEGQRDSH